MEKNSDTYSLIIKYLKKEISGEEIFQLNSWLEKDGKNITEFDKIKQNWIYSDALRTQENTEEALKKFRSLHQSKQEGAKKKKLVYFLYKAASIVLLITTSIFLYLYINNNSEINSVLSNNNQNIIEIPEGEKGQVTLSDGTKIWLNSGSKLTYNSSFNGSREVTFEGEAYFDVAKNEAVPFYVKTSDIIVKVTGTEFNLKSYPDDEKVITTLVEGSVEILDKKHSEEKLLSLKINEVATFNKQERTIYRESLMKKQTIAENKMEISKVQKIEPTIETITSWKENHLIFDNETLEEMVKRMERWYGVNIALQAKNTNERYSGKFVYNEGIEQVLYILSRTTPITYKIDKNNVLITSK